MTDTSMDLHHLVRLPKDPATPAPVLFLFHGLGSNEQDLHGLAAHIPDDWIVISARGPIEVGPNQFKWFDVDRTNGQAIVDVETEQAARRHVHGFIDQMLRRHNGHANRIVVAGFSQGATLSLNLMVTMPQKFTACGAFGGRLMDEIKPQIVAKDALQSKPIFLGFGTQDPFIPEHHAAQTCADLDTLGLAVAVSKDDVGHTISGLHLLDFVRFLRDL